jgi:DnaJ-class molecular chaperone
MDYYRILGLASDCSHDDIKVRVQKEISVVLNVFCFQKSYQKLLLQYHPDKLKEGNQDKDSFLIVQQAWEVLR